jgi:hypothetical protein
MARAAPPPFPQRRARDGRHQLHQMLNDVLEDTARAERFPDYFRGNGCSGGVVPGGTPCSTAFIIMASVV